MKRVIVLTLIVICSFAIAIAGSGIGLGITKDSSGTESFNQANLFLKWGIFAINLRAIDFSKKIKNTYLITPYAELAFATPKTEFATMYGGIAPVISYSSGKINFENLYFLNAGFKLSLAIFTAYVEANFLTNINFEDKNFQISTSPMLTFGGMIYFK